MNNSFFQKLNNSPSLRDLIVIITIAIILFSLAHIFQLFNILVDLTTRWGEIYLDEVYVVLIMLGIAFGVYSLRRWYELQREVKKRKRAEEAIRNLNKELEQHVIDLNNANKELEAFNYTVSHDLRSPLQVIGGFSSILLKYYGDKLDEKGHEALTAINKHVIRMEQLIQDLLAFSHLGKQEIKQAPIDMTELAKTVFEELKLTVPDRILQFTINPLPTSNGY